MQVAGGWVRIKLVQYNLHLKSLGMGSRKCRFLVNVMGVNMETIRFVEPMDSDVVAAAVA